jgi:hypothetical protein
VGHLEPQCLPRPRPSVSILSAAFSDQFKDYIDDVRLP